MLLTILRPPPTIELPRSINNFGGGSASYTAMKCITLFLNGILHGQSLQSVLVSNFTNMHATSYRSDFFGCRSRVNIEEPTFCITITLFSAVSQVRSPSFPISTTMSDSKSLNTSLLEDIMSSKNECVCISDFSDLTLQIIFDAWWASINVG